MTDEQNDEAPPSGSSGDPPEIPVIVDGETPEAPAVDRVTELETALAAAEKDKKENWDKYVRAVADLENSRKRQRREVEDARADTKIRVLKEMLPVVDNLERAIEHAISGQDSGSIVDGLKLVVRQFMHAFERLEVTPIEAENQPFDPNLHEAISQLETDTHPPGTVVSVLQRGYKAGDRLLRPAMVVVAKAKPDAKPEAKPEPEPPPEPAPKPDEPVT
jgi:molecular chaperone GrpE